MVVTLICSHLFVLPATCSRICIFCCSVQGRVSADELGRGDWIDLFWNSRRGEKGANKAGYYAACIEIAIREKPGWFRVAYGGKAGEIEEVQLIGSGARTFYILNKKPSVYFKTQKQREEEDLRAAGELREFEDSTKPHEKEVASSDERVPLSSEGGPLSDGASFDDGPLSELNVPGDGAGSQSLHRPELSAFLASTAALRDMAMENSLSTTEAALVQRACASLTAVLFPCSTPDLFADVDDHEESADNSPRATSTNPHFQEDEGPPPLQAGNTLLPHHHALLTSPCKGGVLTSPCTSPLNMSDVDMSFVVEHNSDDNMEIPATSTSTAECTSTTALHALKAAGLSCDSALSAMTLFLSESGGHTPAHLSLVTEHTEELASALRNTNEEPGEIEDGEGGDPALPSLLGGLDMDPEQSEDWRIIYRELASFASAAGSLLNFLVVERMRWKRAFLAIGKECREPPSTAAVKADTAEMFFLPSSIPWMAFVRAISQVRSAPKNETGTGALSTYDRKEMPNVASLSLSMITRLVDRRFVDVPVKYIASNLGRLSRSTTKVLTDYNLTLTKQVQAAAKREMVQKRLTEPPFPGASEHRPAAATKTLVDNVGHQVEGQRLEQTVYHRGLVTLENINPSALKAIDDVSCILGGFNTEVPMHQAGLESAEALFASETSDEFVQSCVVRVVEAVARSFPWGQVTGELQPPHITETCRDQPFPPVDIKIGDEFFLFLDAAGGLVLDPLKREDYSSLAETPVLPPGAVGVVRFRQESRRVHRCTRRGCSFQTSPFNNSLTVLCRHGLLHIAQMSQDRAVGVAERLTYTNMEATVASENPLVITCEERAVTGAAKYGADSKSTWEVEGITPLPWLNINFAFSHTIMILAHMLAEEKAKIPATCLDQRFGGSIPAFLCSDGAPAQIFNNVIRGVRHVMQKLAQKSGIGPDEYATATAPIESRRLEVGESGDDGADGALISLLDAEDTQVQREADVFSFLFKFIYDCCPALTPSPLPTSSTQKEMNNQLKLSSVAISMTDFQVLAGGQVKIIAGEFHKYQQQEKKARHMERANVMAISTQRRPGGDGVRAYGADCGNLELSRMEGECDTAGMWCMLIEWYIWENPETTVELIRPARIVAFAHELARKYKAFAHSYQGMEQRLIGYALRCSMRTANSGAADMVGEQCIESDFGTGADTYAWIRTNEAIESHVECVGDRVTRRVARHVNFGTCHLPNDEFLEMTNQVKSDISKQNVDSFFSTSFTASGNADKTGCVSGLGSKRPGAGYFSVGNLCVKGASVGFSLEWYKNRHPEHLRGEGKFVTTNGDVVHGSEYISYTGKNLTEAELDAQRFGRSILRSRFLSDVVDDDGVKVRGRLPRSSMSDEALKVSERRHQLRLSANNIDQLKNAYPRSTPSLKPVAVSQLKRYMSHPNRPAETRNDAYGREPLETDSWTALFGDILRWRKNYQAFVQVADEGAPNGEIELMDRALSDHHALMKKEDSTLCRREDALARLLVRVPKYSELKVSTKETPDYGGKFSRNDSLAECLSRFQSRVYGDDHDGVNWYYPKETDRWVEGDWGDCGALDVKTHPRFGSDFTSMLEKAAQDLGSGDGQPKPGRKGGRQREMRPHRTMSLKSRDIRIDLMRLETQVMKSPEKDDSIWNDKWPHPAAQKSQVIAARELAAQRRPVITQEKETEARRIADKERADEATAAEESRVASLPPESRERRRADLKKMTRIELKRVINAYNNGRTHNKVRWHVNKKELTQDQLIEEVLDLHADRPGSSNQMPRDRWVIKTILARQGPLKRDGKIGKKGEYTYKIQWHFKHKPHIASVSKSKFSDAELVLIRNFDLACSSA